MIRVIEKSLRSVLLDNLTRVEDFIILTFKSNHLHTSTTHVCSAVKVRNFHHGLQRDGRLLIVTIYFWFEYHCVWSVRLQMTTWLCALLSSWSVSGRLRVVHNCAHVLTSSCRAVTYDIFADDGDWGSLRNCIFLPCIGSGSWSKKTLLEWVMIYIVGNGMFGLVYV